MQLFYIEKADRNKNGQPSLLFELPHKLSLAAIVARVSPSCTNMLESSAASSNVSLQAMALASAVIALVNSSEFIFNDPHAQHQLGFDAPCQMDAWEARKANKASRDGCLR